MKDCVEEIANLISGIKKIENITSDEVRPDVKFTINKVFKILLKNKIPYPDVKGFHIFLSRKEIFGDLYHPKVFQKIKLSSLTECVNMKNLDKFIVVFEKVMDEYERIFKELKKK